MLVDQKTLQFVSWMEVDTAFQLKSYMAAL